MRLTLRAAALESVVPKWCSASLHCSGDSTWRSRWCCPPKASPAARAEEGETGVGGGGAPSHAIGAGMCTGGGAVGRASCGQARGGGGAVRRKAREQRWAGGAPHHAFQYIRPRLLLGPALRVNILRLGCHAQHWLPWPWIRGGGVLNAAA